MPGDTRDCSASESARGSALPTLKEASCPESCSMLPVARARRSPCPATTPGAHPQQGTALPRRPAHRGRDRRRHARRRHRRLRRPTARLIVVLWRAGLRINEALALSEGDLDARRGSVLVRRGKGGRRREVGVDDWAWEQLQPWLTARPSSRSARCCASRPARPADVRGRRALHAPSCARLPSGRACAVGSRRISSVTRTRSRWPEKECR